MLLLFVLSFSVFTSCSAAQNNFEDVSETSKYYTAVTELNEMQILTGNDENGNGKMEFRPNDTITRAEVAVIVSRIYGNTGTMEQANTVFTDVYDTHWASGYIAYAVSNGIVNGYGDGTFGPDNNVLYQDMVKILVSALGYSSAANSNGGYPQGFLKVADDIGLTSGIYTYGSQPARRGEVAMLTYNAIDIVMKGSSETMRTAYLGGSKTSGASSPAANKTSVLNTEFASQAVNKYDENFPDYNDKLYKMYYNMPFEGIALNNKNHLVNKAFYTSGTNTPSNIYYFYEDMTFAHVTLSSPKIVEAGYYNVSDEQIQLSNGYGFTITNNDYLGFGFYNYNVDKGLYSELKADNPYIYCTICNSYLLLKSNCKWICEKGHKYWSYPDSPLYSEDLGTYIE